MSNKIEIKIDGRALTPDKFMEGAKAFIALVQGVSKNVTGKKLDWTLEVDKGSAIVRLQPAIPDVDSAKSIDTVFQGFRSLRNGSRIIPLGFNRENISSAKTIAALTDGREVLSVAIQDGGEPELVPFSIVQVADEILEGQPRTAFGSIEGKIVSISAKHGFVCVISDPIYLRELTCYLQSDQAQTKALEGFNKRVLAKGLLHYSKEGYAVSITVDDIRVFPPDSDLPTLEEIQEIYKSYN
jgi:hypothetical protein